MPRRPVCEGGKGPSVSAQLVPKLNIGVHGVQATKAAIRFPPLPAAALGRGHCASYASSETPERPVPLPATCRKAWKRHTAVLDY